MATEGGREKPYGPKPGEEPRSAVEREQSPVGGGQRLSGRQTVAIAIACILGVGVVMIALRSTTHHNAETKKQGAVSAGAVGQPFQNNANATGQPYGPKPASLPLPSKGSGHGDFHNPFLHSNQESPAIKALKAPIMAYSGHENTTPQGAASKHRASGSAAVAPQAAKSSALGKALSPDHFSTASAHVIAHPNFTIAAGTIIPCTLETAINSGLPGFVKCVLPQPVRSMTGAVTLLDKGTQVIGEVRHGLTQGQDRLFILWTRAITPQNVAVQLASPAAGALGEAGISGSVDNHFLERFGAAIMMSVIGGSLQAASNAAQHGAGNSYFQYVNQNTNQIANTALQSTIDIPPTLKRPQGANVSIFVARDLNFSNVYKLSLVKP